MTQNASADPPLTPEAQARMKALSEELRCLVCQNQTLADSHAELAVDLRREVHKMIAAGQTNDQIKTYLVERYGDFVLYRPPMQANTVALWFMPFVMLLIGAIVWAVVQRRSRMRAQAATAAPAAATASASVATDDNVATEASAATENATPSAEQSGRERARRMLGFDDER
jgi:cytochrome c-type biogenesis protein CcmH